MIGKLLSIVQTEFNDIQEVPPKDARNTAPYDFRIHVILRTCREYVLVGAQVTLLVASNAGE